MCFCSSGLGSYLWLIILRGKRGKEARHHLKKSLCHQQIINLNLNSLTEFEAFSETHEAVSGVNMADSVLTAASVLPKLELALQKLTNLEFQFDSMEKYVKAVDDKVSNLQVKV